MSKQRTGSTKSKRALQSLADMDYKSFKVFLNSFSKSGKPIENLDRIKGLMKKLGDVQRSLSFVHIAGTNGKGSITEMISCALINAGYKTGQFTSPYIVEFEDRIRINGNNIPKEKVAYYADVVKAAVKCEEYSQFEIIFAIAMLYFADEKVDIVCLEAGLGGALDATNVIDCPLVGVIASISLDHTDILGKTVEDIALQKAGIAKCGAKVIASAQNSQSVIAVIKNYADEVGAKLVVPENFCRISNQRFAYKGEEYELSMMGEHQFFNAASAIEALLNLPKRYCVSADNIKYGVKNAKVKARLEKILNDPCVYFDGAHNPDAALKLKNALSDLNIAGRKIALVGMLNTKDVESTVAAVASCFESAVCVDSFHPNSVKKERLAQIFRQNGVCAYTSSLEDSVKNALLLAKGGGCVAIFGSLYLYGDIMRLIEE